MRLYRELRVPLVLLYLAATTGSTLNQRQLSAFPLLPLRHSLPSISGNIDHRRTANFAICPHIYSTNRAKYIPFSPVRSSHEFTPTLSDVIARQQQRAQPEISDSRRQFPCVCYVAHFPRYQALCCSVSRSMLGDI